MLKKRLASAAQLDGVIDLERLRSGSPDSLERHAARFLDLTFPSDEVHALLGALSKRFAPPPSAGTILAQAVKGLGKSHTLLLAYHLFNSPSEASAWMAKLGYEWSPPKDTVVLVHKFTDRSVPNDALWMLVGNKLGVAWDEKRPPDIDGLMSALGDRHLVLIFDELERGIQGIVNSGRKTQNLNFLQMLSEAANRDARITLLAAVYDGSVEPGATLRRVPRLDLRFRKTEDRASIVRHRLFANADQYDKDAARALVQSYINTWKKFGVETSGQYTTRMEATFPFLPDLVELVFTRITESGAFQGTRSALGLLGAMLDASGEGAYLMTAAHCRINDAACADRLQDLNPSGDLIACAQSNYNDLASQPFAGAIASATLLGSLVPGGTVGLSRDEVVRHAVRPGDDPNDLQAALDTFRKYGTYFHELDGRFRFERHENEHAKVQLHAAKLNDGTAQDQLITVWLTEVFRDTNETVVFHDLEQVRADLEALPVQGRRFILAPRRLSGEERHALYVGPQRRNQVILLEPRDSASNHLDNADLLAYAKRIKAAHDLANSAGNAESRRRYEDIRNEEARSLQRLIKQAGLIYVRVDVWGEKPAETQFEEEPLGQANGKNEVVEQLRANVYPPSLFVEHLRDRWQQFVGQQVHQVDRAYRNNLGYPVPLDVVSIANAVRELVEDPARILGLKHQRLGGGVCGEQVQLSQSELDQAELAHPWPAALPPVTGPGPTPVVPPSFPTSPPLAPPASPSRQSEERSTAHCTSIGDLRQQVAVRLSDLENPRVTQVRFSIFTSFREIELTNLSSAYRGGLTGSGNLELQLQITLEGAFTKSQLEQQCESLPILANGTYAARITLDIEEDALTS